MNGKFETYGFLSFLRLCSIANLLPSNTNLFQKLEPKFRDEIEKYGVGNKKTTDEFYFRVGIKEFIAKEDYNKIIQKIYFSLKINL
jgi:hypothetical protein